MRRFSESATDRRAASDSGHSGIKALLFPAPALLCGLSMGAGLSITGLVAAELWYGVFQRRRSVLIVWVMLWIGWIVVLNLNGFCPMASASFIMVPPAVFFCVAKGMPYGGGKTFLWTRIICFMGIGALALCWIPQLDRGLLFTDIRDKLLFPNALGMKINDFYYRYARCAAAVLETLDQRLLKTCNLDGITSPALKKSLTTALLDHDYLIVEGSLGADLTIVDHEHGIRTAGRHTHPKNGEVLVLKHGEKPILNVRPDSFTLGPAAVLAEFSSKIDRYVYFRGVTFMGLLIGLPAVLG